MPSYRIFYVGRIPPGDGESYRYVWTQHVRHQAFPRPPAIEFEDVVEARRPSEALEAFFQNHVPHREDVQQVADDGYAYEIEGVGDYDPDATYVWIEDELLMEYEGLDEMTPGLVTCPLCNGTGEIDQDLVEYYEEAAARQETHIE
jgi:hypothetical protein